MNYQQHSLLDLDEALALFDDFGSTAGIANEEDSVSSRSSTGRSVWTWCTDDTSDSDLSLLMQLSDSEHADNLMTDDGDATLHLFESSQPQQQQAASKPQRKRKVARTTDIPGVVAAAAAIAPEPAAAAPKIKKPRKHNRIEILKLREQIEELQAQHARLQELGSDRQKLLRSGGAQHSTSNTAAATNMSVAYPRSVWLEVAVEMSKHRQQSEALNRKLRDAVTKQLKVTNSLQSHLQKSVPPQELDELMENPTASAAAAERKAHRRAFLESHETLLAELYQSMESQFHETSRICHSIGLGNDTTSVFTSCSTTQDAVHGPTFELATNTPVPSDFQLLGDVIWRPVAESKGLSAASSPPRLTALARKPSRLLLPNDTHVRMTLPSRFGPLRVDGVLAISKFKEAHRIVITVASKYTVTGSDLVFRESAWNVVSDAASSPGSSLLQVFYRIRSETRDPGSPTGSAPFPKALDEKTKSIRDLVARAFSDQAREYMAELQRSLLSAEDSIESSMLDVKHPMLECLC